MPFLMVRNDIVNMKTDAIVNPSNWRLLQGRGTSRGIFLAAGEEALTRACQEAAPCEVGKAVMTPGFALQARYIIHAVCPRWRGGSEGEEALLYSAYTESMKLALANGLESIAFPLLSSGNYDYPKEAAMRTAVSAIRDFLSENEMTVYLVLYDRRAVEVRKEIAGALEEYLAEHYVEWIDDEYAEEKDESYSRPNLPDSGNYAGAGLLADKQADYGMPKEADIPDLALRPAKASAPSPRPAKASDSFPQPAKASAPAAARRNAKAERERRIEKPAKVSASQPKEKKRRLEDLLRDKPETFSEMLLRLIDERGLKDSDVYNRANIDRRHFSKIRSDPGYMPKKSTVLSFAIALELSYDETRDLLMRAGYAFSVCSESDMIIRFFIENGQYDIFDINETLFYYGQPVLGA
ncbi:MAG: macro domain-containing protein [Lachnospiraceae bacterium]|nr:macro domain-containing protein [Lachnospiraceae bacterium]